MTHLDEKIAEFVFGEMSALEAGTAEKHLKECSDCSRQVAEFRRTYSMLQASPDVDPPRPVVFEIEKAPAAPWLSRWLPPVASAVAASILTALFMTPAPPAQQSSEPAVYETLVIEVQNLRSELEIRDMEKRNERREEYEQAAVIERLAQKLSSQD